MNGLRRTEEGPNASAHLGKIAVAHRAVQIVATGVAVAGKVAGTAQSAHAQLANEDDLSDAGTAAVRSTTRKLPNGKFIRATVTGKTPRSPRAPKATQAGGAAGRGAGRAVTGKQLRSGGIASAGRKVAKVPVQAGTSAGRGAIAAARVASTVAHTTRAMVAALTTALSSAPVGVIIATVVGIVVVIVSVIGWLLPGVQQGRAQVNSNYAVGVAPGPWGGYSNGFIPEETLTEIPWAPGQYLRSDAVTSLVAMNTAFASEFGYNLGINDAYRDYAGQVEAKRIYGGGAADPGESNHGWALAVDFGTGIASFGTPQYRWMKDNAPAYGWRHPEWAEPGARLPEPWHWEFWGWVPPGSEAAAGGAPSDAKDYVRQALGGNALQFQCLERLWSGESNWNPLAQNPSSGAYGIPQALPAEKLATAGADWRTNGVTQVKWGLTYIQDRYGTPCDAWSFWQNKNPHWY